MGNICKRLSHAYAPTYKVQTSLMLCRKRLLFKIGSVCKIPYGGGGDGMTIWPTVYYFAVVLEVFCSSQLSDVAPQLYYICVWCDRGFSWFSLAKLNCLLNDLVSFTERVVPEWCMPFWLDGTQVNDLHTSYQFIIFIAWTKFLDFLSNISYANC